MMFFPQAPLITVQRVSGAVLFVPGADVVQRLVVQRRGVAVQVECESNF
jgi:hypothetical protein